jgi:voltage-gated potassium channel
MSRQEEDPGYQIFMLVLSIYALLALGFDAVLKPDPEIRDLIQYADTAVCIAFFFDFVRNLRRAENRWRYLYTWGWLDLLSSVPMLDSLRVGRVARVIRLLRVFRGIRATKHLAEYLLRHRTESAFLTAVLVSFVVIVFGGIAVLHFEDGPDANIKSAGDALWWAVATMTTVGYGDKFPLSTEGRLIAVLVMTAGVGLFGVLSGLVAAWFIQPGQKEEVDDIAELRHEVKQLRETLAMISNQEGRSPLTIKGDGRER